MEQQPLEAKRGEIQFRRKLARQQVEGEQLFTDEYDAVGIERILRGRMQKTEQNMRALAQRGVPLSPYLEIGAERGQRSLVLENEIGVPGIAADISFEMLKAASYYAGRFEKPKLPLRICCDVNQIPIRSGSLPFAFCYETLHHFPDPRPVVSEIHRVLAPGGHFYLDEEPCRRGLHWNLYKASNKINAQQRAPRSRLARELDFLFAEQVCNETDHGIIENHDIPIRHWRRALRPFQDVSMTHNPSRPIPRGIGKGNYFLNRSWTQLVGGSISALCRKQGHSHQPVQPMERLLICPSCQSDGREVRLEREPAALACTGCGIRYPERDGIVLLLTPDACNTLYPEFGE